MPKGWSPGGKRRKPRKKKMLTFDREERKESLEQKEKKKKGPCDFSPTRGEEGTGTDDQTVERNRTKYRKEDQRSGPEKEGEGAETPGNREIGNFSTHKVRGEYRGTNVNPGF